MFFHWFCLFVFYSFLGWCCETIFCSLAARRWINRGFLAGPFCPIYGFGALFVLLCFGRYKSDPLALFVLSMVGCSLLEYITSWLLEKLFGVSLWDYSGRWGNLNGRVCLRNSLLFGILSVGVVLWIHPAIVTFLRMLPPCLVYTFFLSLMAYLLFDLTITVRALLDVNREAGIRSLHLGQVSATRDTYKKDLRKKAARRFLRSRNRLFRAFPRMRSIRYPEALRELRDEWQENLLRARQDVKDSVQNAKKTLKKKMEK